MAINVTDIYCRHPQDHNLDMKLLMDEKRCPLCCKQYHLARSSQESKALNERRDPIIIISASGMATGGRILHHLKERLPDERTTVLLPGFQWSERVDGPYKTVREASASTGKTSRFERGFETLDGLSAHADRDEIMRWLRGFTRPPERVYVVHGEPPGRAQSDGADSDTIGVERAACRGRRHRLAPSLAGVRTS
jgi:metallo-beta-lactamase family protein